MGTPIILKKEIPEEIKTIMEKAMSLTKEICKLPEDKINEIINALEDYQYDIDKINFKNVRVN